MWPVVRRAPQAAIGLALLAALLALSACAPQTQLRSPSIQRPELTAEHLVMDDGARLPMRRWLPASDVDAVVIALHGFTDYSNTFSGPGTYLARCGIATYAYDQRGFGGTAWRGIWPESSVLTEDLVQVIELVQKLHPKAKLFVLGESMGAAVVLVAMKRHDFPNISGAVLVAPAVWGWRVMNPALAGLLRLLAYSAPWLPIPASEFRKLASDNQAMLEALDRDPLVLQAVRVDALYGLVTLMDDALGSTTSLRPPALVLYGARERIIPRGAGEEFIRRLPASQPVLIYPRSHHTLLRDLAAEVVLQDIANWIVDRSRYCAGDLLSPAGSAGLYRNAPA
jgi:acylglycerol lipase